MEKLYLKNSALFTKVIRGLLLLAGFLFCHLHLFSQNQTARITPGGTRYYEYVPPDYNSNTNNYPIVFFFHGMGERGDNESDLVKVAYHGPPKHVRNGFKFPFILISPQLKAGYTAWPNNYIDAVIEHCKTNLRIDLNRVYLTGLSLGGGGAWGYSQDPVLGRKIAAVAPVCGSGNVPSLACSFGLTNLPVWAFHGDADGTVTVARTINMVNAINACTPAPNPLAKMTIYPGVGHNSWDRAYLTDNSLHTPNVYQWLMQFTNEGLFVNAGNDFSVYLPTNSTTINGSATTNSGTISTYAWSRISGPVVAMTNINTPSLSLNNLVQGVYFYRLTVTTSNGESTYDDIKLTVLTGNQNPVANAGPNRTLTLPTNTITLNGSGSDPDGSISAYLWAKTSGPDATMAGTTTTNLALSNLVAGSYVFSLRVTDNLGATHTAFVTVTVNPAATNQLPVAFAGADKVVNLPTSTTTLTGSGTDADGTINSYQWEKVAGPGVTMTNANTTVVTLSNLVAGVYTFRLTVTDNAGGNHSDDVIVTVIAANQSPSVFAGTDRTITLPTSNINLTGTASDPDGSIASLAWTYVSGPGGALITNGNTLTATITNLVEGTHVLRLTATDDKNATASDEVTVVVNPAIINIAPTAHAGGDKTINLPTNSTTLLGTGTDTDGSITVYAWTKTSGPSVTLGSTTTASLSLSNLVAGIYRFQLTVTDNAGATGTDIATITVVSANQSPTANAGNDIVLTLPTNTTNLSGSATDPDGSIATYAWEQSSGPSTATLQNNTTSTVTVNNLIEGTYVILFTVTDNNGATASDEVSIMVNSAPANVPPVANAGEDKSISLPTNSLTLVGQASDADGTVVATNWVLVAGPSCTLNDQNTLSLAVTDMVAGTYTFQLTVTDNASATASDEVVVAVQPAAVNQSPVASAGTDHFLTLPTNQVTLIGNGTDADGTIAAYQWEQLTGPAAATLSDISLATLEVSALVEGVYTFRLTVTDNDGAIGTAVATVTVNITNQPPTADAGSDIVLTLPENTTLITGTGTDPDGSISGYAWTQISGPITATLAGENTSQLTVSDLVEGTFVFRLTVTDNDESTGTDEVKIVVNAGNIAPVANAGANKAITLPTNVTTFNGNGTDADGTIATYTWTQLDGPETAVLANETTPNLTVTVAIEGVYNFRLTVTDNEGESGYADVKLTVNPAALNQLPVASAGPNRSITLPQNSTTIAGSGSDPDGSIILYQWTKINGPSVTLTNAQNPTLSVSNLVQGTYTFRLTVTDNNNATAFANMTLSVLPEIVNQAPVALAGADKVITLPTNSLSLPGAGSDNDGSIAGYAWTQTSGPSTATLTNASTAEVFVADLLQGNYVFRLTVTDNLGATGTDDVLVRVNAAMVNQAPTAFAGPDRNTTLPTNTMTVTGSGSDPDGTITTYLWTKISGPAVTIAGANTTTLDLTNLLEGTYVFRLTVTDNGGLSASDIMQISVLPATVNQSPVADAGPDKVITLPENSVVLTGAATDADGTITSYTWTVVSGSPVTLANETTPTVTLSGLAAGVYILRLTAYDDQDALDSDDVTVTVNPVVVNQPPVANAGGNKNITLPTAITTLNGSASDVDGSIVRYTWSKVSGPTVTMGATNLTALSLSNLVAGSYIFRLEVEDNGGAKASATATVTVSPATVNAAPIANAGIDISIIAPASTTSLSGTAFDSDGSIATVLWTQVQGAAATLSSTNTLATQVSNLTVGIYVFRLTVTDNNGASAFDEVRLTVNPANTNTAPAADAGINRTINLPLNAITLIGSGSDPDGSIVSYQWTQLAGPGATLENDETNILSLLNLVEGIYTFRLTVTDNQNATGTDDMLLTVLPVITNAAPVVSAGPDKSLELPVNSVMLTGSATDDGTLSEILWEKVEGPTATLTGANTTTLTLSNLVAGRYVFRLTATDEEGLSNSDETQVMVFAEQEIWEDPVVDAGEDKLIQLPYNDVVMIQASAESPNGLIVSYQWTQIDGPPITIARADSAVLVITTLGAGTYRFIISVTDGVGKVASDEVSLLVLDDENVPRPRALFSPDNKGDASTESWIIENAYMLEGCEIVVYNRQGQKVYSTIGYPVPWDGTTNSKPVPDGVYFYVIQCGNQKSITGSVTVARLK